MPITDSIKKARSLGFTDDQIIEEVKSQNGGLIDNETLKEIYKPTLPEKPSISSSVGNAIKETGRFLGQDIVGGTAKGVAKTMLGASQLGERYLLNPVSKEEIKKLLPQKKSVNKSVKEAVSEINKKD